MDVLITDTLDKNAIDGSSASKILLMDKLIEHFAPLFYEDLRKKQGQVKSNEADVEKLKSILVRNKKVLTKLKNDIVVESLKLKILKEIEHLSNIDVLYGKNKVTVQSIISSIDKQSLTNLKKRLALLQKLVNQKKKR